MQSKIQSKQRNEESEDQYFAQTSKKVANQIHQHKLILESSRALDSQLIKRTDAIVIELVYLGGEDRSWISRSSWPDTANEALKKLGTTMKTLEKVRKVKICFRR